MILLWVLLACTGEGDDPLGDCRADASALCCADADCGDAQICHYSYTCATIGGQLSCSEPEGDKRCHDLCGSDTGLGECPEAVETCQLIEHQQGGDEIVTLGACF